MTRRKTRQGIGLALCLTMASGAMPWAAHAQDRQPHQVSVQNQSGRTLREIDVAAADAPGWGGNRLRGQVPSGYGASIGFTGPCAAKLRVVTDAGRASEQAVDLCQQAGVTVTPDALTALAAAPPPVEVALAPRAAAIKPPAAAPAAMPVQDRPQPPAFHGHYLTHHYGGL